MGYTGSATDWANIAKALADLQKRGFSDENVSHDFKKFIGNPQYRHITERFAPDILKIGISRQAISKYRRRENDQTDVKIRFSYGLALHDFLAHAPKYKTEFIHPDNAHLAENVDTQIVLALSRHYHSEGAGGPHYTYEAIGGLAHDYAMFRPAWSNQDRSLYLRSIVRITREAGILKYTEEQRYTDPVTKYQIEELDSGFLIPFRNKVFCLTKEAGYACMKFIVIDEMSPLSQTKPVDRFQGNLIGVSNDTPSPGYPFICRRILDNDYVSRIVIYDELDQPTRNYFNREWRVS